MATRSTVYINGHTPVFKGGQMMQVPQTVELYHHWDGYPTNMVPLLRQAYEYALEHARGDGPTDSINIHMHRAPKAAIIVAAQDPLGYEVRESGGLPQGDLEYVYEVDLNGGDWLLTIRGGGYGTPDELETIWEGPITEAPTNPE